MINISFQHDKELLDPRGRAPLQLAVTLGHIESARVLLRHGADANSENLKYWSGKITKTFKNRAVILD